MKEEPKKNRALKVSGLKHLTVWELGAPCRACTHLVTGPKKFNDGKRLREGFRSLDLAIVWAKNREAEVLQVGLNLSTMDGKVRQEALDCIAELKKHGVKRLSDEQRTAKQHGTSRQKVNAYYLQPVRRSAARQYVSIAPPDYPPGQGRTWLIHEFRAMATQFAPIVSTPEPPVQ